VFDFSLPDAARQISPRFHKRGYELANSTLPSHHAMGRFFPYEPPCRLRCRSHRQPRLRALREEWDECHAKLRERIAQCADTGVERVFTFCDV
jgi:hypothetical protein